MDKVKILTELNLVLKEEDVVNIEKIKISGLRKKNGNLYSINEKMQNFVK